MIGAHGSWQGFGFLLISVLAMVSIFFVGGCGDDDDDDSGTTDLPLITDDDTNDDDDTTDDDAADDDTADDDATDDDDDVTLSGIELSPSELHLPVGAARTLTATAVWSDDTRTTDEDFVFSVSDDTIVEANTGGTTTALARGEATVTASLGDFSADASVNVGAYVFAYDGIAGTLGALDPETGDSIADYLADEKDAILTIGSDLEIREGVAFLVESGDGVPGTVGTEGLVVVDLATKDVLNVLIEDLDNPWNVDMVGTTAYITGNFSNDLVVADLEADASRAIDMPEDCVPTGVHVIGDRAFVACSGYDSGTFSYADPGIVAVVDLTDDSVSTIETTRVNPTVVAAGPDDDTIYIVCTGNFDDELGVIDVIDVSDESVADSVAIGSAPGELVLAANGTAFVADGFSGQVMTFDSDSLAVGANVSIAGAFWVASLAYDPVTDRVLASDWTNAKIQVIDPDDLDVESSVDAANASGVSVWTE
ncbi:MAG: Ig-like domain-containing protein [Deltaproteobacteria bacterium]|nr:Ig-like domain-containing protein [Deltaproteobacteria bacterium]